MEDDTHKKRTSSGQVEVGSVEEGSIVEMKEINGRLIVIKEKAIYELKFADSIDPERTNFNLPSKIQKRLIDKGTESETVSRTFLTAKNLFRKEQIKDSIDCDKMIDLSLKLLSEFSILEDEASLYQQAEEAAEKEYNIRKEKRLDYKLPSIVNIESRAKTIFQKADHIEQILIEILVHFYPNENITKQSHFPKVHQILIKLYGENDDFTKFIEKSLFFMKAIREIRNGVDHRLDTVKISDYELKKDGDVLSPTIELNHKNAKVDRTSLSHFIEITIKNLLEVVEMTFVFLAAKNADSKGLPTQVKLIPEGKRRHRFLNYAFWTPIGKDGFYTQ